MKALEILYALNEAVSLSKNYPSDELLDEAISELEALSSQTTELKMMEEDAQQYALKCRKELEALQQRSCDGCTRLPFILIELAKRDGGKCGTCKRFVKDHYELEPKEQL